MESRDKIFLDTDVILDHLADRQPFAEYAHRIFGLAETGVITIFVSSLSFSNIYYILRKLRGHSEAFSLLRKLKLLVRISGVGEIEIEAALASGFKDFEDAIQYFSAKSEVVDGLITRDGLGYVKSEIPVYSPEVFLRKH